MRSVILNPAFVPRKPQTASRDFIQFPGKAYHLPGVAMLGRQSVVAVFVHGHFEDRADAVSLCFGEFVNRLPELIPVLID